MGERSFSRRAAALAFTALTVVVALVAAVVAGHDARADERPTVERLFPPGGQIGTTVETEIKGKPGDAPLKVRTDCMELQVRVADDNKSATVTIPDHARPGRHWLRFYNDFGTTDLRPFIVGVVPETSEEEPNNLPADAQVLEASSMTVNGILRNAGDVDIYKVDVAAGRTLVASMTANRQLGSPMDAVLQVLDGDGNVVAQNDDDRGMDPQIAFDVASAGTWLIRTFAFPSTPNSTIRLAGGTTYVYRLTVTSGPLIDHTRPALVNRRGTANITLYGWNLAEPNRRLAVPWSRESHVLLVEDFAAPHAIAVVDHASRDEESASHRIEEDSSVTGCIALPKEVDVYTLRAAKGRQLNISAAARSMNSLLDPVLKVTDADGKVLAEADDRSGSDPDGEVTITIPDDRPLSVTVTDRFEAGGWRYFYVLTCRAALAEYAANVAADSLTLTADTPLEIPVTITRTHGFAQPLTVGVEGLPDGVTAEPQRSEPEGDSAGAVTLKLNREPESAGSSGVIRIVCSAEDGQTRNAVAPVPDSTTGTPEIWLTVLPAKPATDDEPPKDSSPEL